MALDKVLKIYDEQGNSVDYDILASDVKFLPDGKDLPTKLTEMEDAIEDAAESGGYTPPQGGIPKTDLAPSVQTSLGLADTALQEADKTQLQNAINSLQSALDTLIGSGNVQGAIDTFNEVKAFLDGIDTDDPTLANQLLALSNAITALQNTLSTKANDNAVVKSISVNGTQQSKDQQGNVNIDAYTKAQTEAKIAEAVDGIEAGETVVINSDGANIVDEHDNNSVLLAPSARQMKLMYNNIMAIYNGLANIAFTNGKPTLDWIGSKTKYTLSYGTMTGCTADVAAGQVNEGALRIKLTPTQASYAFTSVAVNGESASTTATGDTDGSVYLDIVVNGNITVAATAISGRGITFNGTGCSIGAAGVAIGQDLDTTITANEHFTLPASITVKIGNTNVAHTYTRAQDNKTATLHIDAANITGDLTITCTADEEAHAVLNLSNVGSGVTVNKANNAHLYAGDTITIMPASGNKVDTASATVGGNAVTLNGNAYDGYTYTIGSGDVSNNGTAIAITATATALNQNCQITLPSTGNGIASAALTDMNGTAITSPVVEGTGIKIVLTPDTDFTISTISIANLTEGTDYNVTDNNGVKTITIQHVTGNVDVSATAWQPSVLTVNTKWANAYKVDNGVETPITSPVELTDGQPLTIVIKSPQSLSNGNMVDRFVIAADGYGELYSYRKADGTNGEVTDTGTIVETDSPTPIHTQTDDVTAEVIVSDNNAVVTFDKTNNTCTISIASVNGNVQITATGRLKMQANKDCHLGTSYEDSRKVAYTDSVEIDGSIHWVHYGADTGTRGSSLNCLLKFVSDGNWDYYSSNAGQPNYRDLQNNGKFSAIVASFPLVAIFSQTRTPGVTVDGVGVITKDDLVNAYYTKW